MMKPEDSSDDGKKEETPPGVATPPGPGLKALTLGGGGSNTGAGGLQVIERVIERESGGDGQWMQLTRTNYSDWAIVTCVQLQAVRLWDAVEFGTDNYVEDWRALAAILKGVPPEMLRTLAVKDSAKLAWDTIKCLRVGDARVQEARPQTRKREFDEIKFKDGESIEEFSLRLTAVVNDLELLGDLVKEYKAVQKFLRVVPRRYKGMAMAIQSLVDLKTMTIEELCGRLIAVEACW